MEYKINSKKLGKTLTFFATNERGYIFVDTNGRSGTLGDQACKGGKLLGSALEAGKDFETTCKRWYRAFCAEMGEA